MRRPGFTLLEVLIVLALLTILGAIVIPTSLHALGARSVAEAPGRLEAIIAEVRASAQRDGVTMRLVGVDGDGRLHAERWSTDDEPVAAFDETDFDTDAFDGPSGENWTRLRGVDATLPGGLTIGIPDDGDRSRDTGGADDEVVPLVLLTPDGAVRLLTEFEVVTADGLAHPVIITSGLTGTVVLDAPFDPDNPLAGPSEDPDIGGLPDDGPTFDPEDLP